MRSNEETIAAIATPTGAGAVGIIRVSGPAALSVVEQVWEGKSLPASFNDRQIYGGKIRGIDQVLAFVMRAPRSYTGEDVVEIQAHGGVRVLEMILEELVRAGARPAQPGEFTQRAFLNGKLDLLQAEGVADLINAATELGVRQAARQLEGRLSDYVGKLRNELKVMRAQMEAMIDFPEDEDVQGLKPDEIDERIVSIEGRIEGLIRTYREGRAFREGVRVAIVGKPNVGKSSLLNALLNEERAIVHHSPGTTRDPIEEVLDIDGLPVRLIDTAGLRMGSEEVEAEGIRRTRARIGRADLVIVVIDSSRSLNREDEEVFEAVTGREVLYFYNKIDLPRAFPSNTLKSRPGGMTIEGSALKGEGLDALKRAIIGHFVDGRPTDDGLVLTNLRHRLCLEKGLAPLRHLREEARRGTSLEFLVADLTQAMNALAEVTGEVTTDEILGEIFSKFCIGK